jgi:hypothetical protein
MEGAEDEDVDWLAFGARRVRGAPVSPGEGSAPPSPPAEAPGLGAEVVPVAPAGPVAVAEAAPRRPRSYMLPHPSRRTQVQHELAASRMREGKAMRRALQQEQKARRTAEVARDAINDHGMLLSNQVVKVSGVQLVTKTARGQQRRGGFSFRTMVRIALSDIVGQNDLARAWGCNRTWLHRIRLAVSRAFLHMQLVSLPDISPAAAEGQPAFVVSTLAFDETKETLLLPLHPALAPQQTRSSWHVLVSQANITLVSANDGGEWMVRHAKVLRPPVPLLDTSAAAIYDGLYDLPATIPFKDFEASLIDVAKFSFVHFDRDGASSNDLVVGARFQELPNHVFVTDHICGNHRNNLIESTIIATHFAKLVSKMYSASLLLRTGGYFLRLIHAVGAAVEENHEIRLGASPPVTAAEYGKELMDYHIRNYKRVMKGRRRSGVEEESEDSDQDDLVAGQRARKNKGLEDLIVAWRDFLCIFNGHLWQGMVHYCRDAQCCSGSDPVVTKQRMAKAIVGLVFRAMPTVPVKSKWTKTGPCVDFFMNAISTCDILVTLWPIAFSRLRVRLVISSDDQAYVEEMNWHAVQSTRARAAGEMIAEPTSGPTLIIFALVMEPARWLTGWFLKHCSPITKARENHYSCPPLMDYVDPMRSPITKVLQLYSSMLRGTAPRLRLLWMRQGYTSFTDWARDPHNGVYLALLRQAIALAATWTERRFWIEGMCFPWKLASLADQRIPMATRQRLAKDFWEASDVSLDEGFGLRLRQSLDDWRQLFGQLLQRAIWGWAWNVALSVAPVEFAHGRNRRRSSTSGSWHSFVSQYVNAEAKLNWKEKQQIGGSVAGGRRRLPIQPAPKAQQQQRRRRLTARDLHRFEWYGHQRSLGRSFRVNEVWAEVKADWAALAPDMKQTYEDEAMAGAYRVAPQPPVVQDQEGLQALADEEGGNAPDGDQGAIAPAEQALVVVADRQHFAPACVQAIVPDKKVLSEPALPPRILQQALEDMCNLHHGKISVAKTASSFKKEHTHVGRGRPTFRHCEPPRPPASPDLPEPLHTIEAGLKATMRGIVSHRGQSRAIATTNSLVACEVRYQSTVDVEGLQEPDVQGHSVVMHLASSSAQAGRLPFRAQYVLCWPQLQLPQEYNGVELHYARHDTLDVEPLPFGRGGGVLGRLLIKTDKDIGRYLIDSVGPGNIVTSIRCKCVRADLLEGDGWILRGVDDGFEPVTVGSGWQKEAMPRASGGDESEDDWMAFASRKRKRESEARPTVGPSPPAPQAMDWLGEEILAMIGEIDAAANIAEIDALVGEAIETDEEEPGGTDAEAMPKARAARTSEPKPVAPAAGHASGSGLSDSERLSQQRLQCVVLQAEATSGQDVCAPLGFLLNPRWQIVQAKSPSTTWDHEGIVVGQLRVCFDGRTLQATCHNPTHTKSCRLLLQIGASLQLAEAALCKWIIAGYTLDSVKAHAEIGDAVKESVR